MDFINNWLRSITLSADATECPLDLPDGEYLLTLSDSVGATAKRWEIISASVYSGTGYLSRAMEGTTAQDWPAGSQIYCSLTAGTLGELYSALRDTNARVTRTQGMVATLEQARTGGILVVSEQSQYQSDVFGYAMEGATSSGAQGYIAPAGASVIPGAAPAQGQDGELLYLLWYESGALRIRFRGTYESLDAFPFQQITIDGQTFNVTDGFYIGSPGGPESGVEIPAPTHPLTPDIHSVTFS